MKLNVAAKIAAGFGVTLLVFLLVGIASWHGTSELIRASEARKDSFLLVDRLSDAVPLLNEMDLGSRSFMLSRNEVYLDQFREATQRLPELLQKTQKLVPDQPDQLRRLERLSSLVQRRVQLAEEAVAEFRARGLESAAQRIREAQGPAIRSEIKRLLEEMEAHERERLERRTRAANDRAQQARTIIASGTVLGLLVALLAGYVITRNISRPLRQLTAVADGMSVGNLGARMPALDRGDEVGALARAFERMSKYLRGISDAATVMAAGDLRKSVQPLSPDDVLGNAFTRMTQELGGQIRQLVDAVGVLGSSAGQIVAATSELAASATQSAAAVAETTATVEEVRQTAELAAQKARHVSDTAQRAAHDADGGRKSAEDVAAATARMRQQMDDIADHMGRLAECGQAIGQIIASVEDLAVQSNLLAVNAAIEAAKAGEHGKGFGVVAQEVKNLAAQSRQATAEVRTLLGEIQAATASAVVAIQKGGQAVESGRRETDTARGAIEALSSSIHEAAQAATQIAASSQQQLVGVDQVAGAMESIRQASSQNTASARDLDGAARNLNALGHRLHEIVARYKL